MLCDIYNWTGCEGRTHGTRCVNAKCGGRQSVQTKICWGPPITDHFPATHSSISPSGARRINDPSLLGHRSTYRPPPGYPYVASIWQTTQSLHYRGSKSSKVLSHIYWILIYTKHEINLLITRIKKYNDSLIMIEHNLRCRIISITRPSQAELPVQRWARSR